ncbi:MAG: toprim domain-containing protein [Candidatus Shapirobacteria bacterium]
MINPLEHVSPDDLKIEELIERLRKDGIEEIVLATNPTIEGEGTALYIKKKLEGIDFKGKVTRIGSGLPMGAELGFADQVTLSRAFEGRREI